MGWKINYQICIVVSLGGFIHTTMPPLIIRIIQQAGVKCQRNRLILIFLQTFEERQVFAQNLRIKVKPKVTSSLDVTIKIYITFF